MENLEATCVTLCPHFFETGTTSGSWKSFKVAFVMMLVNFYICREKVSDDYEALNERLQTLPDQLSYDIMVGEVSWCHSHN